MYLRSEKMLYKDQFKDFCEHDIELLRKLTECGYELWIDGSDVFGRTTVDINEWLEALETPVDSEAIDIT